MLLQAILSFSNNKVSFPAPFVVPDTPRITARLDSFGDDLKANASLGFNAKATTYFTASGGVQDMSVDGQYRLRSSAISVNPSNTNFQWNDSINEQSASFDTLYAALTSSASSADICIDCGNTNDCNPAVSLSKADYKAAKLNQINADKADFPNWQRYILMPQNRSLDAGASDANYQAAREADLELAEENTFIELGPPVYDLDIAASPDNVHIAASEWQNALADRYWAFIARKFGKTTTGGVGPKVTTAVMELTSVLCTVAHDNGTDITVTPGCEDAYAIEVGGTIYKATSIQKVSETQFRMFFDGSNFDIDDGVDSIKIIYGAMKNLTRVSPAVIIDNAPIPIPIRPKVISSPVFDNPMNGGKEYTLELTPKLETRTGSPVSSVTDRSGQVWNAVSGDEPTYDATLLGNLGALKASDNRTSLVNNTDTTALAWNRVFFVIKVPATVPALCHVLGLGTNVGAQPTPRVSLMLSTDGTLKWYQNESNGVTTVSGDVRGSVVIGCLDFESASNANAYINTISAPVNFDPRDNIPGQSRVWLFGGDDTGTGAVDITCPDLEIGFFQWHTAASAPSNIPSIADMLTFLANQAGGVISS
jgi:hypothetical protein